MTLHNAQVSQWKKFSKETVHPSGKRKGRSIWIFHGIYELSITLVRYNAFISKLSDDIIMLKKKFNLFSIKEIN